jgi:hypothetical protein
MSSYSGSQTPTLKSGSSNFIFIAVAIILVFVVLYYSYNFLFSKIGAAAPSTIIGSAVSTLTKPSISASFVPPYEGGDYTISFWLYVHSNNFTKGTTNYRKHIIDIGGANFSTVAIGLDALQNNLIVRTSSGDTPVSGTTASGGSTGTSFAASVIGAIIGQGNYDSTGFLGSLGRNPLGNGRGAGECTPNGRARDGLWDEDCNPFEGYWTNVGGSGGSGGSLGGGSLGSPATSTYVPYPKDANGIPISPCRTVCKYENMGTGVTNCTKSDLGSSAGSPSCTWNVPYQGSSGPRTLSPADLPTTTTTTTTTTPGGSSTLACATTSMLNSATMASLFGHPVAAACTDSTLPPCDVPEYDLQRWTQITVVLSGKITDVYMNGKLARSCINSSYFKVDVNPRVNVLAHTTFDGQLANLNLYNIALNPAQIYDIYTKGPTT